MKREAIAHPKVVELAAALRAQGVPHADALADGILERLTNQFTARHAPRGDVGRFSDARIARACGWEGDPSWLVSTLVEIGWLDAHSEHRLVLHDWPEHADDATHRKLARGRLYFADGTMPNWRRLNPHERLAAQGFYEGGVLPIDELALADEALCDPPRKVGARRAHVGRTVAASPVPSSQERIHSRIVPPQVRAGQHATAGAPSRRPMNENDRSFSRGKRGAVSLHRPVEPSWAPSPDEPRSVVAPRKGQVRSVSDRVYEMQSRLCDQGDPWNLEVIARAFDPEEIERGLFVVCGRRTDGFQVANAAAYFVTLMKNRAKDLGVRLDFSRPAPKRAAVGASP